MFHRKLSSLSAVKSGVGAQGDTFAMMTFAPYPGALAALSIIGAGVAIGAGKLVVAGVLGGLAVVNAVLSHPDFATGTE